MSGDSGRLVRRTREALERADACGASARLVPREVRRLQARIERLRELDHRFIPISLSPFVMPTGVTPVPNRVGGRRVTTAV